jgi:hypothetical protein
MKAKGPAAAEQILGQITKTLPEITNKVDDFRDSINKVIDQARKSHNEIEKIITAKGITMKDVSTLLSREVEKIYEDLKDEVDDPSLDDHTRRSRAPRDRKQLVSQIMEKTGTAYVHVLTGLGVPQEDAETQFDDFYSTVKPFLLIVGKLFSPVMTFIVRFNPPCHYRRDHRQVPFPSQYHCSSSIDASTRIFTSADITFITRIWSIGPRQRYFIHFLVIVEYLFTRHTPRFYCCVGTKSVVGGGCSRW